MPCSGLVIPKIARLLLRHISPVVHVKTPNTYRETDVSRRQVQNRTKCSKMSQLFNFITIFGISMENAFN